MKDQSETDSSGQGLLDYCMPSGVTRYLNELAAEIVAAGGIKDGQSVDDAIREAHSRRQKFATEMMHGDSRRSKQVKELLCVHVHQAINYRSAVGKCLDRLEDQQNQRAVNNERRDMGMDYEKQ